MQTYSLGWARYDGKGPGTASDSPTLPVNSTNDNNNGTIGSDLGKGGVAGSSIPEEGWVLAIDIFSAVFGALTAVGHLVGFAFYAAALFFAQRLFRCQFRSDRCLFRPAMKWALSLLVWMIGMGMLGFYLSARESFTDSVLAILHSEGFLCQVRFLYTSVQLILYIALVDFRYSSVPVTERLGSLTPCSFRERWFGTMCRYSRQK